MALAEVICVYLRLMFISLPRWLHDYGRDCFRNRSVVQVITIYTL